MPAFEDRNIQPLHYNHSDKMVICFSGGKLSLACALMYKDIGKDIILYNVYESNADYERMNHISEMMNVPLYISHTKIPNTSYAGAHIIYDAMCHAIACGYSPRIVYGYFDNALVENNEEKDWMNCKEFIQAYKNVAQKYVDGFSILNPVPNYSVMWDEILKHKQYMPYIQIKDKTDDKVFSNIKMDYRIDTPDKSVYLNNFRYLIISYKHRKKANQATLNEIWNEYFFYRIENSLFYKDLMERYSSI